MDNEKYRLREQFVKTFDLAVPAPTAHLQIPQPNALCVAAAPSGAHSGMSNKLTTLFIYGYASS